MRYYHFATIPTISILRIHRSELTCQSGFHFDILRSSPGTASVAVLNRSPKYGNVKAGQSLLCWHELGTNIGRCRDLRFETIALVLKHYLGRFDLYSQFLMYISDWFQVRTREIRHDKCKYVLLYNRLTLYCLYVCEHVLLSHWVGSVQHIIKFNPNAVLIDYG